MTSVRRADQVVAPRVKGWAQAFGQQVGSGPPIAHGACDGTGNVGVPAANADDGSLIRLRPNALGERFAVIGADVGALHDPADRVLGI